jgi:hypothetical protein
MKVIANPFKLNKESIELLTALVNERNLAIARFQDALASTGAAMGIDKTNYVLNLDTMIWVPRPKKEEKKNV